MTVAPTPKTRAWAWPHEAAGDEDGRRSPALATTTRNHLLRRLEPEDLAVVLAAAEGVVLERGASLATRGRPDEWAYFPETATACVTARSGVREAGVAFVGFEGVLGLSLVFGDGLAGASSHVLFGGRSLKMSADAFGHAMRTLPSFRSTILLYVQAYLSQVATTATAIAMATVEERVARWLSMARDRTDLDGIAVTHDTVASTMAVRRPSVTVALHMLEGERAIRSTRGHVHVLDRERLRAMANGSYGGAESEYERLLGGTPMG